MAPLPTTQKWPLVPIKRFAELVYGDALPADKREDGGEVLVYGSNGPFGSHSLPNTAAPVVLVGRKGSVGALNWSDAPIFAIDTVYFVDELHADCNLRWLYWALQTADLHTLSQDTGVPGLSREMAYGVALPLPNGQEQAAIATFLDRETGKIDALVQEQRRLIDLLKEKRQGVITHAVTKGLNPNAKMKDSGVEWLGDVPEHWEVRSIGSLSSVVRGASPRPAGDARYFGGSDVPWVTVAEITGSADAELYETQAFLTSEGASQSRRFKAGTLIYSNSGATLGVPKILMIEACANDGVVGIEQLATTVNQRFLYHFLGSITTSIRNKVKQGAGQPNLNTSIVRAIQLALPPLSAQGTIVAHVEATEHRYRALEAEATKAQALLLERRAALVSAAVTGKIDLQQLTTDREDAA